MALVAVNKPFNKDVVVAADDGQVSVQQVLFELDVFCCTFLVNYILVLVCLVAMYRGRRGRRIC